MAGLPRYFGILAKRVSLRWKERAGRDTADLEIGATVVVPGCAGAESRTLNCLDVLKRLVKFQSVGNGMPDKMRNVQWNDNQDCLRVFLRPRALEAGRANSF